MKIFLQKRLILFKNNAISYCCQHKNIVIFEKSVILCILFTDFYQFFVCTKSMHRKSKHTFCTVHSIFPMQKVCVLKFFDKKQ